MDDVSNSDLTLVLSVGGLSLQHCTNNKLHFPFKIILTAKRTRLYFSIFVMRCMTNVIVSTWPQSHTTWPSLMIKQFINKCQKIVENSCYNLLKPTVTISQSTSLNPKYVKNQYIFGIFAWLMSQMINKIVSNYFSVNRLIISAITATLYTDITLYWEPALSLTHKHTQIRDPLTDWHH